MDIFYDVIGWIASILVASMIGNQTLATMKSKNTKSLSKQTFLLFWIACFFWMTFSVFNQKGFIAQPFVLNSFILVTSLIIFYYQYWKQSSLNPSKHDKLIFISEVVITIILFTILMLAAILNWESKISLDALKIIELIAPVTAGSIVAYCFIPQTFRIMKSKKLGAFNIKTCYLQIIAQFFWIIFWMGHLIDIFNFVNSFNILIPILALSVQIPVLYIYYKYPTKISSV